MKEIKCPHCGNDVLSLIEVRKEYKGSKPEDNKIIYGCEVCSKEFEVK